MAKLLRNTVLIAVIALFIIVLLVYIVFELSIKSTVKKHITEYVSNGINSDFDFEKIRFSFANLLRLCPSLKIYGVKIGSALTAKEVLLELYLKPLIQKKFNIKRILIDEPYIALETNARNEILLRGIKPRKNGQRPAPKPNQPSDVAAPAGESFVEGFLLDFLQLKNGELEFYPYGSSKPLKISDIHLELRDFKIDENSDVLASLTLDSSFFNKKTSSLMYKGTLGPINKSLSTFDSLKSKGSLEAFLKIKDIPLEIRNLYFGNVLLAPNDNDRLLVKAEISGDLLDNIYASGTADLNNISAGKSSDKHLNIKANVPINMTSNIVHAQKSYISIDNANIDISGAKSGRLTLNTKLAINIDSGYITGSSHGKFHGLEINDVLSSFTGFENFVFGVFEMPSFKLNFQGLNAEQFIRTLNGSGSLVIKDGRIDVLDKLLAYKDKAQEFLNTVVKQQQPTSSKKTTENFSSLESNFHIANSHFYSDTLRVQTPVANIEGNGFFNFSNQKIKYDVDLIVKNVPNIPIDLRGTVSKPKLKADFNQLANQATQQTVNKFLEYGLQQLNKQLQAKPNP